MRRPDPLKDLDRELARFHGRLKTGAAFVALLATVLLAREFYLQITQHAFYTGRAESNRISLVPIAPNRGLILDSKGRVLAENYSAYTLEVTRAHIHNLDATLAEVGRLIEITPGQLRRFRRLLAESHEFETVPLKSKLTDEEVAILAANRYRLPGIEVKARLFRNYQAGPGMAHVVGFIGRINDRDLKQLRESGREQNYQGGAHIGKTGLEQSYETLLHGRTGFDQMETDSGGRAVRVLSRIAPVPGKDLRLYLDRDLQEVAEHAFGDYLGGLVALDPNTGGVLALVSKPGFDPQALHGAGRAGAGAAQTRGCDCRPRLFHPAAQPPPVPRLEKGRPRRGEPEQINRAVVRRLLLPAGGRHGNRPHARLSGAVRPR